MQAVKKRPGCSGKNKTAREHKGSGLFLHLLRVACCRCGQAFLIYYSALLSASFSFPSKSKVREKRRVLSKGFRCPLTGTR